MAFSFLLFPAPLPLPSPAPASSYLVSVHHGRRGRRPLEHGCRCGRPPETVPGSTSSSGGVGSSDGEDDFRPVGVEDGAFSSGRQTGSVEPGYQATSTEWDTSKGDYEGWQKKQYNIDDLSKRGSKSRYFQAFGVDLSPDNVAVAIVYFVQGVLGLSRLAVSFYLKDDLNLDPAETAVISGFSALPWLVKPLYGFISDSIPLFGYRRRSYLILSGLLGALSWSLMATIVDDKYSAALSIVLGSLAVAFSDVVVDSMVVERARGESQSTSGSLQSLCWGSSAFGGAVSAYFSGSLVDTYGVRFVFGVTALLPLMTSAVAVLVNEERLPLGERSISLSVSGSELFKNSKLHIMQIWNSVKQPNIFLPTLFIFLWQATPQSDSAMFYFITNKLGFTPEFLGRVKLVTSVASLLGIGVYNTFFKAVPLRYFQAFGVDLSPDNVAVAIVYFVQGVLGLSRLAVSFYLKDDLNLDPAETAVISGFSALPWLVKPLYGFISDSIPLFGYRRRSYLILSGLLGALSWSLMATIVDDKYSAALSIVLGSLAVAVSDVVVDSMVVERARGESQSTSGSLQSLCWGSSAFGGAVSAYFSGSLVDTYGVRFVFGVTALLPLMTSAVAVLVNEERLPLGERSISLSVSGSELFENSKLRIMQIWNSIKQPNIFLPTLFIFLWQATPQSDSAMFYFITNKLGFTPEFLGRVKLVTSVASLLGIGVYNTFFKAVPLRKIFLVTTILGSALGMTQVLLVTRLNRELGISDEWFTIGDSLIITVLGQASFMPVLVLAAKLCPPGVEATLFATLMSISNAGGVAGGLVGAGLTQLFGVTRDEFGNLALLIAVSSLSSLLPLPLLNLLPDESPDADSAQTKMD